MADKPMRRVTVTRVDTKESLTRMDSEGSYLALGGDVKRITPEMVKDMFQNQTTLLYTMSVKALTEQGAKVAARRYVRSKNFFEPSAIEITSSEKAADSGNSPGPMNTYLIGVGIRK